MTLTPDGCRYEVCKRIRELYPGCNVPIIMLSAKSGEDDIVEGLHSGANDYITKPFGREELLARVEAHLQVGG